MEFTEVLWQCMVTYIHSKSMDQLGKVANPARGQLNKEHGYFPVRVYCTCSIFACDMFSQACKHPQHSTNSPV